MASMFGATVEHLVLRDSPVCAAAGALLRCYLVATMPKLLQFNDVAVAPDERIMAEQRYRVLVDLHASCTNPASRSMGPVGPGPSLAVGNKSQAATLLRSSKVSGSNKDDGLSGALVGDRPQISDVSRSALYHRQIRADFETAFEAVVRGTIRCTLEDMFLQEKQQYRR